MFESSGIVSERRHPTAEVMTSDLVANNHSAVQKSVSETKMVAGKPNLSGSVGLFNVKAMTILWLWYFFSCITLFFNKHIVSTIHEDATVLCTVQIIISTLLGLFNMYVPCGMYTPVRRDTKPSHFHRNMALVGVFRFLTIFLGLVALKYVPVSFTETVKSSAPIFTVFISGFLLGERNGWYVQCSLLPIMGGLALCCAHELSFNMQGFVAALATNLAECLQFVYSKLLISGEKFKSSPAEFQFYTSLSSLLVQLPIAYLLIDMSQARQVTDWTTITCLLVSGVAYHYQTMMAWMLMDLISPVTHSVTNVVKRAILIWLSVLWFGNAVTLLSGIGTIVVTAGVLLYNRARQYEHAATVANLPSMLYREVSTDDDDDVPKHVHNV